MKIILAIDSFKGCLSSVEAEQAAFDGIKQIIPEADIISIPIADGGEGMLEAMMAAEPSIEKKKIRVHDPLMRPITTSYGISYSNSTAIIEMALTSGLNLISLSERNPMNTTTYGLGEMIRDAVESNLKHLIIGIGGSATNDAGIGLLSALGYKFLGKSGELCGISGSSLLDIQSIEGNEAIELPDDINITVASDVSNPLYGKTGAAYIFAPQKGASSTMVKELDNGLKHFADIVASEMDEDYSKFPGAGAAGGVGFALKSFLHAEFILGIELVLNTIGYEKLLSNADIVITGEGCIDAQTLSGKVPFGILKRTLASRVPVIAIAGKVDNKDLLLQQGFHDIIGINPVGIDKETAMNKDYAINRIRLTMDDIMNRFINNH
jgi:glycerate kinase